MGSDLDLIKSCKRWDKVTTYVNEQSLYSPEDYSPLGCIINEQTAEVTVGSSPGHKTHIDLEFGNLEYYDTDEEVNLTMTRLLRKKGLDCAPYEEGVRCSGVNKGNLENVFIALAAPTSMDFRVQHRERWWGNKKFEEIKSKCDQGSPTNVAFEACAIDELVLKADRATK